MRIAISSSTFRRPLASGELTQLEWLEGCASVLGSDGVVADIGAFPRRDDEYVAQLRKVAVDLGLVPFGVDAPGMLEREEAADALATAQRFGAVVLRTTLPPPGDVPPATFVETVARGKTAAKAAKAANVTLLICPALGSLAEDMAALKHLLKDVDSAWLRACPPALSAPGGGKDRYPAFAATPADDPVGVAAAACRGWVILDAPEADRPWDVLRDAIAALRAAEAERRVLRS